jgi:cysteine desulfurase/selenocysteine lyase
MEHHSNIVPWQLLCERTGAVLRVAPISDAGEILLEELERLIGPRTKLVAVGHVSNALGTLNPVRRIVELAHARGVPVLVDGAQGAPHLPVDVRALDCDFYAFSGHKMYGPSGIGVLSASRAPGAMPPFGRATVLSVTFEDHVQRAAHKFEAGTPTSAIALGAAVDSCEPGHGQIGAEAPDGLRQQRARQGQAGSSARRSTGNVISFVLDSVHPHDMGTVLDYEGIALRTGHHCAQPVMDRFGIPATARVSLGVYNTREEIDALVQGLLKVAEMFR